MQVRYLYSTPEYAIIFFSPFLSTSPDIGYKSCCNVPLLKHYLGGVEGHI